MQNKGKVKLERKHKKTIIMWFLLRVQKKIWPGKKHTPSPFKETQCPVWKVKHKLEGSAPISHHG